MKLEHVLSVSIYFACDQKNKIMLWILQKFVNIVFPVGYKSKNDLFYMNWFQRIFVPTLTNTYLRAFLEKIIISKP